MRRTAGVTWLALLTAIVTFAALPADAATKPPGLLRPTDLRQRLEQTQRPRASPTITAVAVDPRACTETPRQLSGTLGARVVQFSRPGDAAATTVLFEDVAWFPSAQLARSAFSVLATSNAAAVKCGTLVFVPPTPATPSATVRVARVEFPRIGSGSYAQTSGALTAVNPVTTVAFVSGAYVVIVGTTGAPGAPSVHALASIVARARARLIG
jgi:hypothetical protein